MIESGRRERAWASEVDEEGFDRKGGCVQYDIAQFEPTSTARVLYSFDCFRRARATHPGEDGKIANIGRDEGEVTC